jgi:hypothetical protein
MKNDFLAAAFPTHPVQDKFGSLMIQFGLNKLELSTLIVAAGISARAAGDVFPETIAGESLQIALACLEACDDEVKKAIATNSGLIKSSTIIDASK